MSAKQTVPQRLILVVEDAPGSAATLELALSPLPGLSIRFVKSAEDALQEFNLDGISMLITDVNLPMMDGLELVERLRANPRTSILPMLVLSGDPDPETPGRALLLGADAFFAKPYSPAAVRRKVEELLNAK